jgi:hypothetical protein
MSLVSVCHKRDIRKSAGVLPDFGFFGVARNAATRADRSPVALRRTLVVSTVTTANSIASVKSSSPTMYMLPWCTFCHHASFWSPISTNSLGTEPFFVTSPSLVGAAAVALMRMSARPLWLPVGGSGIRFSGITRRVKRFGCSPRSSARMLPLSKSESIGSVLPLAGSVSHSS